ncbi:MAG: hypothetical protein ACOC5I_00700 [Gemmatimonadota bacterium]
MSTQPREPGLGPSPGSRGPQRLSLPWPPPGLARLHGDAYYAIQWLVAAALLVLPLLWVMVADEDPLALGLLGDSLWPAFLLGLAGVPIVLGAWVVTTRLFRRWIAAVRQGHHWWVVALVAVDHRRDTGFLLQGDREYRLLTPATRRRLANLRIVVGGLFLFAALWLTVGFGLSVLLAARGALGPWGVVLLTLAPAVVAAVLATVLHGWEEGVLRKSRRHWHDASWAEALTREEVRSWNATLAEVSSGVPPADRIPDDGGRARFALHAAHAGLTVAGALAFIPVFSLVFTAAIIPVLGQIAVPEFGTTMEEYAALEPLRSYALPPDTAIRPVDAGASLHALSYVGHPYRSTEGVLPPTRTYEAPWFPVDGPPAAVDRSATEWGRRLVAVMGRPLDPEDAAYLERVSTHPAHRELDRLARAPGLDVTAVRWAFPVPSEITLAELSVPVVGRVRDAAYARLARAAVQASGGDVAAADTTLRQLLSAGLLLADESPSVLDNMVGVVMARMAGDALESLYRNTDRAEAEALAWGTDAAQRSVERARVTGSGDIPITLRAMPGRALDTAMVRGIRWEYLGLVNTVGPCMNLRRVVFGPDAGYRSWLREAELRLVRYPSESQLFQVARGGLLGQDLYEAPSFSTRLLSLTMGGGDQPGSCVRILGDVVGF